MNKFFTAGRIMIVLLSVFSLSHAQPAFADERIAIPVGATVMWYTSDCVGDYTASRDAAWALCSEKGYQRSQCEVKDTRRTFFQHIHEYSHTNNGFSVFFESICTATSTLVITPSAQPPVKEKIKLKPNEAVVHLYSALSQAHFKLLQDLANTIDSDEGIVFNLFSTDKIVADYEDYATVYILRLNYPNTAHGKTIEMGHICMNNEMRQSGQVVSDIGSVSNDNFSISLHYEKGGLFSLCNNDELEVTGSVTIL